jgi:hypothetical protein
MHRRAFVAIVLIMLTASLFIFISDARAPSEFLTSDNPLPDKVVEALKSKVNIRASFFDIITQTNLSFTGTGVAIDPNLIVSARHIIANPDLKKFSDSSIFFPGPDGIVYIENYIYKVFVWYGSRSILLKQIGVGALSTSIDIVVFKQFRDNVSIPTVKLQKTANLGDTVYMSGITNVMGYKSILDTLEYTFAGTISAILTDQPDNVLGGTKKVYRIRGNIENGFSGGPLYNSDGELIGMLLAHTQGNNFVYAISAEDIEIFLKNLDNN